MMNDQNAKLLSNEEIRERFREYGTKGRAWTDSTKTLYDRAVDMLFSHADKQWHEITADDIEALQHWMTKGDKDHKGLAAKSRGVYVAGIKAFYNWLTKKDILDKSRLVYQIEPVRKQYPKAYKYLTKQDGEDILRALDGISRPREWNTRIVIRLGMIGLRDAETLGLKVSDIDWKGQSLNIRGIPDDPRRGAKNDKDRTVFPNLYKEYFGFDIFRELRQYLETHPFESKDDYVVRNLQGKPTAPHTNADRLHRVAIRAIGRQAKFHALRHWCATLLSWHGVDMNRIQDHLGHANVAQTSDYIHTDLWRAELGMEYNEDINARKEPQGVPIDSNNIQNGDFIAHLVLEVRSGRISEDEADERARLYHKFKKRG